MIESVEVLETRIVFNSPSSLQQLVNALVIFHVFGLEKIWFDDGMRILLFINAEIAHSTEQKTRKLLTALSNFQILISIFFV
jgi:hypothetical protein